MYTRRSVLFAPIMVGLLTNSCTATPPRMIDPATRRVALVVGNGNYGSGVPTLRNPPQDAKAVAASLDLLHFQTELVLDGDRGRVLAAVSRLADRAAGADAAVFYFAGHAAEAGGHNLLFPSSVTMSDIGSRLLAETIDFDEIAKALGGKAKSTVILLDSCRDNPFSTVTIADSTRTQVGTLSSAHQTRSVGSGLASVSTTSGSLVVFATAPGRVAMDGDGEHSPFTQALLRRIRSPNLDVRQMLGLVRRDVREATGGEQIPWDNSSLEEPFYFRKLPAGLLAEEPPEKALRTGQKVFVDDGRCPSGQVLQVTAGDDRFNAPRKHECVPTEVGLNGGYSFGGRNPAGI